MKHYVNQLILKHAIVMDNENKILELLIGKIIVQLNDLNMGCTINEDSLSECWDLLHILHYATYDSSSDFDLYKILDYYE